MKDSEGEGEFEVEGKVKTNAKMKFIECEWVIAHQFPEKSGNRLFDIRTRTLL